jgi:hypothetical protein
MSYCGSSSIEKRSIIGTILNGMRLAKDLIASADDKQSIGVIKLSIGLKVSEQTLTDLTDVRRRILIVPQSEDFLRKTVHSGNYCDRYLGNRKNYGTNESFVQVSSVGGVSFFLLRSRPKNGRIMVKR